MEAWQPTRLESCIFFLDRTWQELWQQIPEVAKGDEVQMKQMWFAENCDQLMQEAVASANEHRHQLGFERGFGPPGEPYGGGK